MANGIVQLRLDETLKQEATEIFSQLGLDLPTAIRMFLTRSVQVRGIPFSLQLTESEYKATAAVNAAKRLGEEAKKNGTAGMSLDEINAEIEAARREKE